MSDPALLLWNRLEGKPRSQNLEEALRAEVRDPLWMLCRQWQFGEFRGEDAAAPVFSRVQYKRQFLSRLHTRQGEQIDVDRNTPLNPLVEATPFDLDLSIRIEIGLHWVKLLKQQLSEGDHETVIAAFYKHDQLRFTLPTVTDPQARFDRADELSNAPLQRLLLLISRHQAIDGAKLLDAIVHERSFGIAEIDQAIQDCGEQVLAWIERVYHFKFTANTAWHDSHLEYQFDLCSDEQQADRFCLKAEEYFGKAMQWYQFDYEQERQEGEQIAESGLEEAVQIPVQVNYIGMPKTRWWEMEDAAVNFGNIKTTTDNPARLLFTQFNLVYGNDWFMLPLEVRLGELTRIESIIVADNFGLHTRVAPTPTHSRGLWSFFNFFDREEKMEDENWFYYPATATDILKSEPIEQVNFIRDEMANMVWGIEKIVPDQISKGMPGSERANQLAAYLQQLEEPDTFEGVENEARFKYQLTSTVPEHWIPFIPVKIGQDVENRQIQLQRAAMPRLVRGFEPQRIRPRTSLLHRNETPEQRAPYYIYEEEIPRAGAIVTGRWKRTRWLNGRTLLWYAREKTVGRGEGHSGLKFDYLENKSTTHSPRETKDEASEERTGEISISLRSDLPETWQKYAAPDLAAFTERYYPVDFAIGKAIFPVEFSELKIQNVALHFITKDGKLPPMAFQLAIGEGPISYHMAYDGMANSWSGDTQERWENIIGQSPISTWRLAVPNNDTVWGWFDDGLIEDIELKIYYEAEIEP